MARKIELFEVPEVLEEAEVSDDSSLGKYNDSFAGWNERAKEILGKMESINGELAGSSPFMFVRLHNSGALPADVRLSTREDLEKAIKFYADNNDGENFTGGIYSDIGIALRTPGDTYDPNNELAKKLAKQLEHRDIALNKGVLIPFAALKDRESKDEPYGITWDLNDFAAKEAIRDLREFNWDYSRDEGLACALRFDWDWYSDYRSLGRSDDVGRVVVVRAVGTSQKILEQKLDNYAVQREKYITGLKQLRDKIDAELGSTQ